jgi:Fe-coproporphyrin III synthase
MTARIETLPILVLHPHSRCNCRCIMCDIWKETNQAEISEAELTRHLDDIQQLGVRWVVFSGGEPLMHSDLFRLADLLRLRHIRVTLLSSGLLLRRFANEIATRIDDLIVSLDGPPKIHDAIRRVPNAFIRLAEGVRTILNLNSTMPISARCTVQQQNHDHIVKTARSGWELGLKSLSFLAADSSSAAFNRPQSWNEERQSQVILNESEIGTLETQFEALQRVWRGTNFIAEGPEKLARVVRHFRANLGLVPPESPRCNAPWVSTVIETDGTVRPCFFQPPIGSLKSDSLLKVVNGFEAQAFRASLNIETNSTCRRCVCSLYLPD